MSKHRGPSGRLTGAKPLKEAELLSGHIDVNLPPFTAIPSGSFQNPIRDHSRRFAWVVLTGKIITSESKTKMRITSKGQVTIPQELRERFGLLPNTEVEFVPTPDGRELRLLKSSKPSGRGRALIERMRGRGTGKRSTDELLKLMRSDV